VTLPETLRIEGGRVRATLIRLTGDIDLAEDALQDAVLVALEKWADEGLPRNPAAWLTAIARNKALDRIRREARRPQKEREASRLLHEPVDPPDGIDDRLRLIFTCCHPALSPEARIALTLRTVCGLTTPEIARVFLTAEPTMGQRISRAKKKIATARIPYRVPADHELPDRLPAVLAVIYLIYTTGHHSPIGSLDSRVDLAAEAIRLARVLTGLMPDEPEVSGLLALMIATQARSETRLAGDGTPILLADQDRSRWDHHAIAEASSAIEATLRLGRPGPYQVQAAIAVLHGEAPTFAATDWRQIVDLYRLLERLQPTPVVRVNRAVAEAELLGPEAGLDLLEDVDGVAEWHLYWSARAELLRRAGNAAGARTSYERALRCAMNESDRLFLEQRLAELDDFLEARTSPRTR
jgi:RNA polymerase sigma-70 factor (ECF subfamily)